jgi:hypothetical protein
MHLLLADGDLEPAYRCLFIPEERTRGIARHAPSTSVRVGWIRPPHFDASLYKLVPQNPVDPLTMWRRNYHPPPQDKPEQYLDDAER